ncbi:ankyrin repeat-containing domain protein [Aspergillus crustosus]
MTRHNDRQRDIFERSQESTGGWLLGSQAFETWTRQDHDTPHDERSLWCPGNTIGYFFCKYDEEVTLADIYSVFLEQLIESQPSIPKAIDELYEKHRTKHRSLGKGELLGSLKVALLKLPKVFLFIDALNEGQLPAQERRTLLKELFDPQQQHTLGLFVTSLDNWDIGELFKGKPTLRIRADEGDVERCLRGQMHILSSAVGKSPALQQEIVTAITNSIDGMFLLAKLLFDSLKGLPSVEAIRKRLRNLPARPYDAYDDAMGRIKAQGDEEKKTAMQVLKWISCSPRPLSTIELRHALSIGMTENYIREENVPDIGDLLPFCGGLVVVDEQSDIVRLVHYTLQQYFDRGLEPDFQHAHSEIGRDCVHYLPFDGCPISENSTRYPHRCRRQKYPLFEYAVNNWAYHVRKHEAEMDRELILTFLLKKDSINDCINALSVFALYTNDLRSLRSAIPREAHGIHLAASAGLIEICKALIEEGEDGIVDVTTDHGHTALYFAAIFGHHHLVKFFIEQGASRDIRTHRDGETALCAAVSEQQIEIVETLLDQGADINASAMLIMSLLYAAVLSGSTSVLKLLLKRGADPLSKSVRGSPLRLAAALGQIACFEVLLDALGPDILTAIDGKTLEAACWAKSTSIINQIWNALDSSPDRKADLANLVLHGDDPLDPTMYAHFLKIRGAAVNNRDDKGRTVLSAVLFLSSPNPAVVQLLLEEYKADPNAKDNGGRCPLSIAVGGGWYSIVSSKAAICRLLLDTDGIDIDSRDINDRTPMHYISLSRVMGEIPGASFTREESAKLMVERGCSVDSRDAEGRSSLSYAAERSSEDLVPCIIHALTFEGKRIPDFAWPQMVPGRSHEEQLTQY